MVPDDTCRPIQVIAVPSANWPLPVKLLPLGARFNTTSPFWPDTETVR